MSVQPPDQLENEEVLRIFREIDKSPQMTQRELSSRLGISLGKINFLINALIEQGFVKVENFRKSSSKSAYLYYLTPMGIEKKARTTYLFLKKKIREYEWLAKEIAAAAGRGAGERLSFRGTGPKRQQGLTVRKLNNQMALTVQQGLRMESRGRSCICIYSELLSFHCPVKGE